MKTEELSLVPGKLNLNMAQPQLRDECALLVNVIVMQVMSKYEVSRDAATEAIHRALEFNIVHRKLNAANVTPLKLSTERLHRK